MPFLGGSEQDFTQTLEAVDRELAANEAPENGAEGRGLLKGFNLGGLHLIFLEFVCFECIRVKDCFDFIRFARCWALTPLSKNISRPSPNTTAWTWKDVCQQKKTCWVLSFGGYHKEGGPQLWSMFRLQTACMLCLGAPCFGWVESAFVRSLSNYPDVLTNKIATETTPNIKKKNKEQLKTIKNTFKTTIKTTKKKY